MRSPGPLGDRTISTSHVRKRTPGEVKPLAQGHASRKLSRWAWSPGLSGSGTQAYLRNRLIANLVLATGSHSLWICCVTRAPTPSSGLEVWWEKYGVPADLYEHREWGTLTPRFPSQLCPPEEAPGKEGWGYFRKHSAELEAGLASGQRLLARKASPRAGARWPLAAAQSESPGVTLWTSGR